MTQLSWVQPEDLLTHELVQGRDEGLDVTGVAARWLDAGGWLEPPVGGTSDRAPSAALRSLAGALLDELDRCPRPAALAETEPDGLDAIEHLAAPVRSVGPPPPAATLLDRVHGGWVGRASGCLLGKPVEKIPRSGIREILESGRRWPLADYFTADGLTADVAARWPWNRRSAPTSLVETIDGMPEDDDLNFAMLALSVLEAHGRDFTTDDVADAWLAGLPGGRVFTAERVAYRNLLEGVTAPETALVRNPFREWIGAQIRTDVYGWATPGRPWDAARLAWRDARLSHRGNGLYGGMFVAAACAAAVVVDDVDDVVAAGLSVVPAGSRYAAAVRRGVELGRGGRPDEESLDVLQAEFGALHWVHSLNNAALVAYALTRGGGELGPSICTAVTGGWDTDSDGATVGSVCGALTGAAGLPARWVDPLRNRVTSSLPGFDGIGFDTLARRTVAVALPVGPA